MWMVSVRYIETFRRSVSSSKVFWYTKNVYSYLNWRHKTALMEQPVTQTSYILSLFFDDVPKVSFCGI